MRTYGPFRDNGFRDLKKQKPEGEESSEKSDDFSDKSTESDSDEDCI